MQPPAAGSSAASRTSIRPITVDDDDFDRFLQLVGNAYLEFPVSTEADRLTAIERLRPTDELEELTFFGAYRGNELVGGMRTFDFSMRVRSAECFTGGVGVVFVGMPFKQRGIARELISYFLRYYHARGAVMTALYPFRPDFYRSLGFGYGVKLNQYRIHPHQLPRPAKQEAVRLLTARDAPAVIACYDREFERGNGLMRKIPLVFERQMRDPTYRFAGYERDGMLAAYVTYSTRMARPGNANSQELAIEELVYDDPAALGAILGFLRSQGDQFGVIVVNTQDDGFHFLPHDPRNGTGNVLHRPAWSETNAQGIGIMYRCLDTAALFAALGGPDFGSGSCTVGFEVQDELLPHNAGRTTVRFQDGVAQVVESEPEVLLALDVAEFSSLAMGAVRLRPLVDYGKATISDARYIGLLDRILAAAVPPRCTTVF